MPDWWELVRERLSGLALEAAERNDVQAELAAHLDETCERLLAEGLPEQEAVQRTLALVPDWQDLGQRIAFAKKGEHFMKNRIRQLWMPGFLALVLSMLFLWAVQRLGFQPRVILSGPTALLFYVPWLLSLPFIGALGAHISSRAGGSRGTVLLASVFPSLALAGAFLLMFPIGMATARLTGNDLSFPIVARTLLKDAVGWLLLPGAALLLGGFLAHLLLGSRSSSQRTAIG